MPLHRAVVPAHYRAFTGVIDIDDPDLMRVSAVLCDVGGVDLETVLAERECERLLVRLVRHLDLGTPSDAAGLFTPDGVWEWPACDRRIEGRDALADYFGSRPANRLSRRLTTNVLVTVTASEEARATSYFATYRVDGWDGGLHPPPPATQVGHYEDAFRRADGVWLLAHRTLHLAFGGPTPRSGV